MTNDQAKGITGAIQELGSRVLSVLPPAFIALILVNIMFVAVVLFFEHSQSAARAELIHKLIDRCVRDSDAK